MARTSAPPQTIGRAQPYDLDALEGKSSASSHMAIAFNALLDEAKRAHGDNPVVASMQSASDLGHGKSDVDVGTLRVLTGQLLAVVPRPRG